MSELSELSELPTQYNAQGSIVLQNTRDSSIELSLNQSKVLAAYIVEGSLKAACREAGITIDTHYRWVRENEAYRLKFQAVAAASLDEARARLDVLLPRAAEVFEEGLEAQKRIEVVCPACEHEFSILVANLVQRLSVAKDLFKRSGDLAAKVQVSGEVKHRDMALEDRLALAQVQSWEAGGRQGSCPVPPDVYDDLSRRGLLGSGTPATGSQLDSTVRTFARGMSQERDDSDSPQALDADYREIP